MARNELTTYKRDTFLSMAKDSPFADAMAAMDSIGEEFGPEDLIRVKTPAEGRTKWTIEVAGAEEETEAIEGILVLSQKNGVLWPSDDPIPGTQPVLRSFDLIQAERVSKGPDDMEKVLAEYQLDEDGLTYDWANLPYNKFGSGKNGHGKRCKEQRMLFILRQGDIAPLLVRAQPGSLKTVKPFIKQLAMKGLPFFRAVVQLKLQKVSSQAGQQYSQIVPKLIGCLSAEDGAFVKKTWTDKLMKVARQVEEVAEGDDE